MHSCCIDVYVYVVNAHAEVYDTLCPDQTVYLQVAPLLGVAWFHSKIHMFKKGWRGRGGGGKRENTLSCSTQRQMKLDDVAQRKSVNLGPHLFCQ